MLKIIRLALDGYQYLFQELRDQRTKSFFLTGNPIEIILLVGLYLKFVLDWGPKFMKDRRPYELKNVMIVYNILQIMFNGYLVYIACNYAYGFGSYSYLCEPIDYSNTLTANMALNGAHFYYMCKVIDLLDTVFFVLRKKWKQISFLHLFHHSVMCLLGYFGAAYIPGGHAVFSGLLNSFVHIVMYFYYLVAAIDTQGRTLWWKKYITQLQIIQFFLVALHWFSLVLHPGCGYPKGIAFLAFPFNTAFMILFANFYYKTYIKKNVKKIDK